MTTPAETEETKPKQPDPRRDVMRVSLTRAAMVWFAEHDPELILEIRKHFAAEFTKQYIADAVTRTVIAEIREVQRELDRQVAQAVTLMLNERPAVVSAMVRDVTLGQATIAGIRNHATASINDTVVAVTRQAVDGLDLQMMVQQAVSRRLVKELDEQVHAALESHRRFLQTQAAQQAAQAMQNLRAGGIMPATAQQLYADTLPQPGDLGSTPT
jgi:hypothetical protein